MDLGSTLVLVAIAGLILWLPLIGKKWSAITSSVIFGSMFLFFAFGGYQGLSQPPLGASHDFARASLWIAGIAGAMLIVTVLVYRARNRRQSASIAEATIK